MIFLKTLRGKLTIIFFVSTVSITVLTFFLLIFTTQKLIFDQVNHHLHIVINEAKNIVEENHEIDNIEPLKNLVSAQGMTVILLSSDGSPVLQTNSFDVADVTEHQMQQIIFSSTNKEEPQHFSVNEMQFATVPVNIYGYQDGILAVGFSTKIINNTIKEITTTIIFVLLLSITVVSILWQAIIKHYLLPLEKISQSALQIKKSSDLNKKVKTNTTTIELKNITVSFNNLLEKLKQVFEEEHLFFSDTAHSLKTPLAVIRSYIEILPKQEKKKKNEILDYIDSLNETIQDLLIISRINTSYPKNTKQINFSNVINNIVELTQTIGLEKNITVNKNIEKDIFINADEQLLIKSILNIIKNSVDHENQNGTITINLSKQNKITKLSIKDTGVGISSKDLKNVFNRFYQSKNSQSKKGNGLGLAITKAIIESFGGKISISSKINKGTSVFIFFS